MFLGSDVGFLAQWRETVKPLSASNRSNKSKNGRDDQKHSAYCKVTDFAVDKTIQYLGRGYLSIFFVLIKYMLHKTRCKKSYLSEVYVLGRRVFFFF